MKRERRNPEEKGKGKSLNGKGNRRKGRGTGEREREQEKGKEKGIRKEKGEIQGKWGREIIISMGWRNRGEGEKEIV